MAFDGLADPHPIPRSRFACILHRRIYKRLTDLSSVRSPGLFLCSPRALSRFLLSTYFASSFFSAPSFSLLFAVLPPVLWAVYSFAADLVTWQLLFRVLTSIAPAAWWRCLKVQRGMQNLTLGCGDIVSIVVPQDEQ